MFLFNLFLFLITVIFLLYVVVKKKYSYWERNGVPFVKPIFPYGNFKGVGSSIHWGLFMADVYSKLKGTFPFVGLYVFVAHLAMITDLDLIKNILVKDFNYFADRGVYSNEEDDPLSAHLFTLEGTKWKNLRAKMSPTFTSGKLKLMLPIIAQVGEELQICLDETIKENSVVEIRDVLARFTTDNIGRCAFGIDCNSLIDPNTEFRKIGKLLFDTPRHNGAVLFFLLTFRDLAKKLHFKFFHDDVSSFVTDVIEKTIAHRESSDVKRNDFMDLMLQIKNKGKLDDDDSQELVSLTVNEIAAQALIFFAAGFHTSSITVAFALHELTMNQDIQDRVRKEIHSVLKKYDGEITYEGVMEMKYLDMVLSETLRKYPIAPNLVRKTTTDYKVPGTDYVFKKDQQLMIPIYAIHHDPEYYPEPEVFDPDRFTPEAIRNRHHYAYIPFGEGPRICIGMRFGLLQAKMGLISVINNYTCKPCYKTINPIKFSCKTIAFLLSPEGGIWLNMKKIIK